MVEILAPAGDEKCAYSAINAGADAIYLGLSAFSARSSAENFDCAQLEKLLAYAHLFGVKVYVAMNTLIKDSELNSFLDSVVEVWNLGADAIIMQDVYLGAHIKKQCPEICLHLSTQAGVCNAYGARYAKEMGFSRVILARETKLADIKEIAKIIETEVFVQGALCTCFSGQCYLSSFAGGNSGNRGKCKQPCRKKYSIDREGFDELAYRISLSDLSVVEQVSALMEAGVSSFKIEGRMRRAEYVSASVNYYKKLLSGTAEKSDLSALKRAYNRGNYTKGLSFGQDKSLISSAVQGHIGEFVGAVKVESGKYVVKSFSQCSTGDAFKILREGKELCGAIFEGAVKGGFTVKSNTRLRTGDKVFITTDNRLNRELLSKNRLLKVSIGGRFTVGESPWVSLNGEKFYADFVCDRAQGRPLDLTQVITCFSKTDIYPFELSFDNVAIEQGVFVPVSKLNAFRRQIYAQFTTNHFQNGRAMIGKRIDLPIVEFVGNNNKIAVISTDFTGVQADIGILKPTQYREGIDELFHGFKGERFLYLPPYISGEQLEGVKPLINAFDGIYCGGNYSVALAKELKKKLFAGVGFNLFNAVAVASCPADYVALSKELTAQEAKKLCGKNTFYLSVGGIKVMDLIYCPFERDCNRCDRRNLYTLTDENSRKFPLRRYTLGAEKGECTFELYNCAELTFENNFTGVLADLTCHTDQTELSQSINDISYVKTRITNRTSGHTQNPVL